MGHPAEGFTRINKHVCRVPIDLGKCPAFAGGKQNGDTFVETEAVSFGTHGAIETQKILLTSSYRHFTRNAG